MTGDGVHRVEARDGTGGTDVVLVPIDATAPEVAFGTPANGRTYDPGSTQLADYECIDRGSGAVTCNGTVNVGQPISTTLGTKTFSVTTRDRAGNEATRTITYNVAYRKILFTSQRSGCGRHLRGRSRRLGPHPLHDEQRGGHRARLVAGRHERSRSPAGAATASTSTSSSWTPTARTSSA